MGALRKHKRWHGKGISGKYQKRVTLQQLTERYARKREVSDRPGCISWECSECKKLFSTKQSVQIHAENVHLPKDPGRYTCNLCDYKLHSLEALRQHKRWHANGEKGKNQKRGTFQQLTERYARKREVSDRPGCISWECSECKKSFSTKYGVQIHAEYVHLPKDPGRYTCNQCDYKSHSLDALRKHKRWHANGEKGKNQKRGTFQQLTERYARKREVSDRV